MDNIMSLLSFFWKQHKYKPCGGDICPFQYVIGGFGCYTIHVPGM